MESTATLDASERQRDEAMMRGFEADVAGAAGVRNAADGRLVDLTVDALEQGLWQRDRVHTPVQWLMWKAGLKRATARAVTLVASRAGDLPTTVALLGEGRLSLDQAATVARFAPAAYEESVCELAENATVAQIVAATKQYVFDVEAPETSGKVPERSMAFGSDDDGSWWARIRLGADEGKVVEEALTVTRDRLHDQARAAAKEQADAEAQAEAAQAEGAATVEGDAPANGEAGDGTGRAHDAAMADPSPDGRPAAGPSHKTDAELGVAPVSWANAMVGMANAVLGHGPDGAETGARPTVHLHLERPAPGCGEQWRAEMHGGPALPSWLRRYLLCDCDIEVVWNVDGIPVSTARHQRNAPRRIRRLVEYRDRLRCRVPGCTSTRWLQVHHIVHWEDDGETVTWNLCCLCSHHHRMHHQDLLGITGNADLPGGLTFTNRHGFVIEPAGRPRPPTPADMPDVAPYRGPTGERLQKKWVHFNRTPAPGPAPGPSASADTADSDPPERPAAA